MRRMGILEANRQSVRPGARVVATFTCPECDGQVAAVDGDMDWEDLRAIRRGARPKYALHARCTKRGRGKRL